MPRRPVKFSRARARTGWLLWLFWGIFGAIFLFEDHAGGSLTLSFLLTAPLWLMFALWPLLWFWRIIRRDPTQVTIDEDIAVGENVARLVEKDGVRYVEAQPFLAVFHGEKPKAAGVKLEGGEEVFLPLEAFRAQSRTNKAMADWMAVVDGIGC